MSQRIHLLVSLALGLLLLLSAATGLILAGNHFIELQAMGRSTRLCRLERLFDLGAQQCL